MKIQAKEQVEEGVFVIPLEEALKLVDNFNEDMIHEMDFSIPHMAIGCDFHKERVTQILETADKIAVLVDPAYSMRHQLVALGKRRFAFDVGYITPDEIVT